MYSVVAFKSTPGRLLYRDTGQPCGLKVLGYCRVWLPLCLVVLLLDLAGCSSKQVAPIPPLAVESTGRTAGTRYLPGDDGISLTRAEQKALRSSGTVDKGIAVEDMRDVTLHFKYFVHIGRYTVEKNLERAQAWLPFIRTVFREKGLPEDLAWIAFIESGYNPMATSHSGAAGVWQFIPSTGKIFGMRQDWWMDERRDTYKATCAAADYLARLYNIFKDWPLAITAYNAGEGRVSRGLAATGADSFFELRRRNQSIPDAQDRLKEENQQYYPKFVAVCRIMRNLDALGFSKPDYRHSPHLVQLTARPETDLKAMAQSLGLSWEEFFVYNTAYRRQVSPPGRQANVYVPAALEAPARFYLENQSPSGRSAGWRLYTVVRGDSMIRISRKTGVPVAELRRLNPINEPLRSGYRLKIPISAPGYVDSRLAKNTSSPVARPTAPYPRTGASRTGSATRPVGSAAPRQAAAPAAPPASSTQTGLPPTHIVAVGETVYSIARRYGLSQDSLLAANGLKAPDLYLGQQLIIPTAAGAPAGGQAAGEKITVYLVQAGDTLWSIARKCSMSLQDLLTLNKISLNTALQPGDTLRVRK